jgi:hypothetical protein
VATVLEILARKQERNGNLPEEFDLREAGSVDADIVLRAPNTSLYMVAADVRSAVFAELPPEVDITLAPFSRAAQFEHAQRLIAVSFEELERLADSVPQPERLIFFYNTARSGTTLLHHMLNRVDGVASLAEANFFVNLLWQRDFGKLDFGPATIADVLRWSLRMQAWHYADRTLVFKLRNSEVQLLPLINEVAPDSGRIMLYRDALAVGASWKQQYGDWGWDRDYSVDELGERFLVTPTTQEVLRRWLDASPLSAFPAEVAVLSMWIDGIVPYLDAEQRGAPFFTLRYDDLVAEPERMLRKLLTHFALPVDGIDHALGVLPEDSQAGTEIARKQGRPNQTVLDTDEVRRITDVLAMHPRKLTPDIVLPGTVSL